LGVTANRVGEAVEVLPGASSLPEGEEIVLFTASNLKNLDRERRDQVDLQMPSFLPGDKDVDAEDLFSAWWASDSSCAGLVTRPSNRPAESKWPQKLVLDALFEILPLQVFCLKLA
jgi:hypothetical protein